jgi:hypothetical protein
LAGGLFEKSFGKVLWGGSSAISGLVSYCEFEAIQEIARFDRREKSC